MGATTRANYDQAGRETATYRTFALGLESQLNAGYDAASRVTVTADYAAPGAPTTSLGYDADGALVSGW